MLAGTQTARTLGTHAQRAGDAAEDGRVMTDTSRTRDRGQRTPSRPHHLGVSVTYPHRRQVVDRRVADDRRLRRRCVRAGGVGGGTLRVRRARRLPAQRFGFIGLGDGGLRFKIQPNCDDCVARSSGAVNRRLYGTPVHFVAHPLFQETYSSTPATSCRLLDWVNDVSAIATLPAIWQGAI